MTNETIPDFSEDKERIATEVRGSVEDIRSVLVAAVSLAVTLTGWRPQAKVSKFKTRDNNQAPEAKKTVDLPSTSVLQSNIDLNPIPVSQPINIPKPIHVSKPINISQTVEAPQEINKQEGQQMNTREIVRDLIYMILAATSTVAIVIGVSKLEPIAQGLEPIARWAKFQNECIEENSKNDGNDKMVLPMKVMSCNGGHE